MAPQQWLDCDFCRCSYSAIRRPGDRCYDLSWVPNGFFQLFTTKREKRRVWRSLMCRGRVWPEGEKRRNPRRLMVAEQQRMLDRESAPVLARREQMYQRFMERKAAWEAKHPVSDG